MVAAQWPIPRLGSIIDNSFKVADHRLCSVDIFEIQGNNEPIMGIDVVFHGCNGGGDSNTSGTEVDSLFYARA